MKIQALQYNTASFRREPNPDERFACEKAVKDGLRHLGIKNMALGLHGNSFPAGERDTGVGSPYSKTAAEVIKTMSLFGFNNIQLGPDGKITEEDVSPYASNVFGKNYLFIDLEKLTSDEYGKILSKEDFEKYTDKTKVISDNYTFADYPLAFERFYDALTIAKSNLDPSSKLAQEYENFKEKNSWWLEKSSIFEYLNYEYGTREFNKWKNQTDANLIRLLQEGDENGRQRYNELKSLPEIEVFNFAQFLIDKQEKQHKLYRSKNDFKYISDILIGFSANEKWSFPGLILDNYTVGCPYGGKNNGPQLWKGVYAIAPDTLFKKGTNELADGGKLLERKFEYIMENFENVRIDHVLGLIDPYVISHNGSPSGNIIELEVDKNKNYFKILEHIIIPLFKRHNIPVRDIVCEDLCTWPEPSKYNDFQRIHDTIYAKSGLTGLKNIEHRRAEVKCSSPFDTLKYQMLDDKKWSYVGSHDSLPAQQTVLLKKDSDDWNKNYLAGFLNPDPKKSAQRDEFRHEIEDSRNHVMAKFTELFRSSKNIQIFFADLFGINEVYNNVCDSEKGSWKLRMAPDWKKKFYESLSSNEKNYALNIPELIKKAIIAKDDMMVAKFNDIMTEKVQHYAISGGKSHTQREELYKIAADAVEEYRQNLKNSRSAVIEDLDKFIKILKEKE